LKATLDKDKAEEKYQKFQNPLFLFFLVFFFVDDPADSSQHLHCVGMLFSFTLYAFRGKHQLLIRHRTTVPKDESLILTCYLFTSRPVCPA
jgi:hypothetical protein